MSSASAAAKKTSSASAVRRRSTSLNKDPNRASTSSAKRNSQSVRLSAQSNQRKSTASVQREMPEKTTLTAMFVPPRPPDPTLFIRAGTTGVRHLLPVHLGANENSSSNIFSRPISRLRSRTPTTELCTNVEMIRNVCSSIKTLQYFDVSHNELTELPLDISLLTDLESLNCSHNQLTDISQIFDQLKRLKELDLSFNQFQQLPSVLFTMKSLTRLNLEHNCLSGIDIDLLNLKRLKFFIADHNQLEMIDSIDFSQLKKLEYIHCAHNQLMKFPRGLQQLNYLKNVNLSNNRLKSFPIDILLINTLDVLNLSHNLIVKLPPMPVAYKRSAMIFSIDLSSNQLNKFYDYLLFIAWKVDVSNNKIRTLSNEFLKRLTGDLINNRELKINNNPITQPALPTDLLQEEYSGSFNALRMIRTCFDEQQLDSHVRQGFKISITGTKNSGKTALASCLEELVPITVDDLQEEKHERFAHVHQFTFRMTIPLETTSTGVPINKLNEGPRFSIPLPDFSSRKRRNLSVSTSRLAMSMLNRASIASVTPIVTSTPPTEVIRSIPLSIYDFSGSQEFFVHTAAFIDTYALHLLCVPLSEFSNELPKDLQEIFDGNFGKTSTTAIHQLVEILRILSEKANKTRAILIIPIATFHDLYESKSIEEQTAIIERIDEFFRLFRDHRRNRIQEQIDTIQSLPVISSSLSDRLKTFTTLMNIHVQIDQTHVVSSLTYHGIEELIRKIQRCVMAEKSIFPHVERILPTLWAEANNYIESLADLLPMPYLLWKNFSELVVSKHGLQHLIDEITMSLHEEGKIFVINEIGTADRAIFLRPTWLLDLIHSLFRLDMKSDYLDYEKNEIFSLNNMNETRFHGFKKEFLNHGLLHIDLLRIFWSNLTSKKDPINHIWLTLMRFLLIGYPKMNKGQLRRIIEVQTPDLSMKGENRISSFKQIKYDQDDLHFEYAVVPHYLPSINVNDLQEEVKRFHLRLKNVITIRYTTASLPVGLFNRFSVSAVLRLNLIYKKHWNNFIHGEHEEKDVQFVIETDHRTVITCSCGTNIGQQPFEEIWNILMPVLNHFEEMFLNLAPSSQYDRLVQCPLCFEFSFMGEWTTPKELQCTKSRACTSCHQQVDTFRLVQPNESKRRSEELLKRIRERHAKSARKESEDTTTNQVLVSPV